MEYDKKHKLQLKNILATKLKQHFTNTIANEKLNKKRISALQSQIDTVEEQLVLNKITKEQFDKYHKKYADDINQLQKETEQQQKVSANLEKAIEKGLKYAENLHQNVG